MSDTRNETQRNHLRPPAARKRAGRTPESKVAAKVNEYLDAITRVNLRTGAGVLKADDRVITVGAAGTSDRTVCLLGRFVAVETKGTGTLTPAQIAYRERVLAESGIYLEVRSVDELRASLAEAFGAAQLATWDARLASWKDEQRMKRLRPEKRA
jgi:hypothetical protein